MYRLIILIVSAITFSCNTENADKKITGEKDTATIIQTTVRKENFQRGIVLNDIKCITDNSQSFALYIPENNDSTGKMPVVYFFDSHGDGSLPLLKYKNIADIYKYILIGSNNSKNGNDWNTTSRIWSVLSNDTRQRLNMDESQIYAVGFSGGAKVASFIATTTTAIKSVISNSAAYDGVLTSQNNFSLISLAGTGDMNMTEVVNQNNELNKTARQHQLILFDGKHEWAPEACMKDAFWFLYSKNLLASKKNADENLLNEFLKTKTGDVKLLQSKNNLIKAEQVCRFVIQTTETLSADLNFFKDEQKNILKSPLYRQQLVTEENLLKTEIKIKEELMQKLSNPDMKIWEPVISDFNASNRS